MNNEALRISPLPHTWILDLDGTILKHNGYLDDGEDSFLDGALDFVNSIPKDDLIIILTSRKNEYKKLTIDFLNKNNVRYDHIIFEAPYGERILINDKKNSGLETAVAINTDRDSFWTGKYVIDENL